MSGMYDSPAMLEAQQAAEERNAREAKAGGSTGGNDLAARLYPTMVREDETKAEAKPDKEERQDDPPARADDMRVSEVVARQYRTPEIAEGGYESIDQAMDTIGDPSLAEQVRGIVEESGVDAHTLGRLEAAHVATIHSYWDRQQAEWQSEVLEADGGKELVARVRSAVKSYADDPKALREQIGVAANSPHLVRLLGNMQAEIDRLKGKP